MEPKKATLIDGYMFESPSQAEKAMREYENIQKIKSKLNAENLDDVKKVYLKLVKKGFFNTPVGIGFLHQMRDYLIENGETDIEAIPVVAPYESKNIQSKEMLLDKLEDTKKECERLEYKNRKLIIAVIALIVMVVGMIFISVTNENVGYFNAEEKILDKYSAWQERLELWEEELIEREEQLSIME